MASFPKQHLHAMPSQHCASFSRCHIHLPYILQYPLALSAQKGKRWINFTVRRPSRRHSGASLPPSGASLPGAVLPGAPPPARSPPPSGAFAAAPLVTTRRVVALSDVHSWPERQKATPSKQPTEWQTHRMHQARHLGLRRRTTIRLKAERKNRRKRRTPHHRQFGHRQW